MYLMYSIPRSNCPQVLSWCSFSKKAPQLMCSDFVRVLLSWSTIEQLTCQQLFENQPFIGVLQHSCSWKILENPGNNQAKSFLCKVGDFQPASLLAGLHQRCFLTNFPEINFAIFWLLCIFDNSPTKLLLLYMCIYINIYNVKYVLNICEHIKYILMKYILNI